MSSVTVLVSSFSMIVIRQVVNDLVYFLKTINFLQLQLLLQRTEPLVDNEAELDNKQKKGKKPVKKKKKASKQHAMLERNNIQNYTNLRQ